MTNNIGPARPGEERRFFRRADLVAAAGLLLLALGIFLWWRGHASAGAVAVLTITDGPRYEMPLNKDKTYTYESTLPLTIEVKDGAVRFVNSQCPDHICEGFGWLRNAGEYAICLPGNAYLSVEE